MKNVQRTRAEHLVEDGRSTRSHRGRFSKIKPKFIVSRYPCLVQDGQLAALAIIKISPLDDDNRDEVRRLSVLRAAV